MKRIFIYLALLTIGLSFSSCTEEIDTPISDAGALTITLKSSDLQTKTMEGVQSLNENLIQTIHYFLYPNGGTGRDAVLKGSVNTNKQITESFTVPLDENILNQLFPYPQTQCQVFLIVNLPNGISIPQNTSIDNLKTIALSASFASDQLSFVMAGQGVATLADKTKNPVASGDIKVDRTAAKLTLNVDVAASYTDGSTVWTSIPNDMTVSLYNCINNNAQISGEPVATPSYINITNHRFDVTTGSPTHTCSCDPFYSYPIEWEPGTETEPYFMIMLPWKTGNLYQPCYYKVILNGTQLERNNWYNIDLNLGILGSFNETEPKVVVSEANYYVVDWSTGKEVTADIQGARYLVVEQEKYIVYNEQELTIPFNTSHDCEIVNVKCTYPNLSTNPATTVTLAASEYSVTIKGSNILFTHELNNDMLSRDLDFTPFTVTLTIQHSDNDDPDNDDPAKQITIIQYPAIYAEAFANTDYTNGGQGNSDNGFVWVNGYQGNTTNQNGKDYFGGAGGNSRSADPRMLVFTITTTEGTDFIIGDPRSTEYTYTADNARWASAPATAYDKNGNRELNYYYGTAVSSAGYNTTSGTAIYANDDAAEAAEPTINMIAPKFRLSSGYGTVTETTGATSLETMKKRCASYQEDGYPAGRWRLPTRAEFQFIYTQICYEKLPEVYFRPQTTANMSYWCAHGLGTPNNNGLVEMSYIGYYTGRNTTPVRCVYDEWYWENSETYRLGETNANGTFVPSDTFTWGDMPREAFDFKTTE